MKHLILKAQLTNRDGVEMALEWQNLDLSPIYWQHDRIYVPRNYQPENNYPRLIMRTEMHAVDEPPQFSLILRRHIEDSGIDVTEHTPITGYAEAVNIILQLGFKPAGEVSRRRESCRLAQDDTVITLHLDELDGRPATYLKLEQPLEDGASPRKLRQSLSSLLFSLAGKDAKPMNKPYFEL